MRVFSWQELVKATLALGCTQIQTERGLIPLERWHPGSDDVRGYLFWNHQGHWEILDTVPPEAAASRWRLS